MHPLNPQVNVRVSPAANVDADRQYVFIHIPKNGGTSVRKALGLEGFGGHGRWYTYADLLGPEFDRLFSFCFVRNPWSRFLSMYNYVRLKESYYHSTEHPDESLYGKHRLYDLLCQSSLNDAAHYLVEGRLRPYTTNGFYLFDPQYAWIYDDAGRCRVDFVGRYERLEQDFAEVCKHIGQPGLSLPHVNQSTQQAAYRDHYDAETRHLIAVYYEQDIEAFQYTF